MPGRILIDESRAPVAIPAALWNEMCAHALEAEPEECCGLVSGDARRRYQHVHHCRNDMTALHQREPERHPHDGRTAFHMNELDYADVDRAAAARGLRVTAIYHSHVGLGAYFSEEDRGFASDEDFPFPDADHFVISVFEGKVRGQGLFRREGPVGEFAGWPVVPEHA